MRVLFSSVLVLWTFTLWLQLPANFSSVLQSLSLPLCFSQVRKFVAKDSAGLRVRSHPSLQSEQIGIVQVNGTITFIDEVNHSRIGPKCSFLFSLPLIREHNYEWLINCFCFKTKRLLKQFLHLSELSNLLMIWSEAGFFLCAYPLLHLHAGDFEAVVKAHIRAIYPSPSLHANHWYSYKTQPHIRNAVGCSKGPFTWTASTLISMEISVNLVMFCSPICRFKAHLIRKIAWLCMTGQTVYSI